MFQQRGPRPSPEQNSGNHWTFPSGQEIPSQSGGSIKCSNKIHEIPVAAQIFFISFQFFFEMIFRILETFLLEPFASEVYLRSLLPWLIEMELVPLCGRWGFRNCFTTLNFKDSFGKGESPQLRILLLSWNDLKCRVFGCSCLKCSTWLLAVWSFLKKNQSARKHVATLFLKTHLSIKCHDKCSQFSKKQTPCPSDVFLTAQFLPASSQWPCVSASVQWKRDAHR